MTLPYKKPEEINDRYSNSIIFYKGFPVYCWGTVFDPAADPNKRLEYMVAITPVGKDMVDQKKVYKELTDPGLSDGPYRLGYINNIGVMSAEGLLEKSTVFCSRVPVRRWKQGLTKENLAFSHRLLNYGKAVSNRWFAAMLAGSYPSWDLCVGGLKRKSVRRAAYDRHWCLGKTPDQNIELFYRGYLVGNGEAPDQLKLKADYKYLQELFDLGVANATTR